MISIYLMRFYWKRNRGKHLGFSKGQIIYGNALYFKKINKIIDEIEKNDLFEIKVKILKIISICLLYGYTDYAIEIFEKTNNHFENKEKNIINNKYKNSIKTLFPFLKENKLANLFHYLWQLFEIPFEFGTCDKKLGNL